MGDKVAIDFNFVSDWLRERCEFSQLVVERSKAKTEKTGLFASLILKFLLGKFKRLVIHTYIQPLFMCQI